mgnify:CR=1 FL=1
MEKVYPDIVAIMEALSLQEEAMDTIPSIDDYQSDESGVFAEWIGGLLEGKHVCSFGVVEIGLYAGELFDKDRVFAQLTLESHELAIYGRPGAPTT